MICFDETMERAGDYGGSEFKKTILYNNELYMVKFPDPVRQKNNDLSYKNNQFSEHIGSQIFKMCDITAQETKLGYFEVNTKKKIVVACKDFTSEYGKLIQFSSIAKAYVESGVKTKLTIEGVYDIINNSNLIKEKAETIKKFWDMFVIDAFIGNTDRHFSNWGLVDKNKGIGDQYLVFSPVYDCGSSLGALIDDDKKALLLKDDTAFKNIEYNVQSVYSINSKRIFYHQIFKNPPDDLIDAIQRIVPKINMTAIVNLIKKIEVMSDLQKTYMIKSLELRNSMILQPSLKKILKKNLSQQKPSVLVELHKTKEQVKPPKNTKSKQAAHEEI